MLAAVHPQAVVTEKVVDPAAAATFWFDGVTAKVQTPTWVTVTTMGVTPVTVTVILAVRELVEVLAV